MTLIEKFQWLTDTYAKERWSASEIVLCIELIRKWNSVGRKSPFTMTDTEIQKKTGMTRPTISRARRSLIKRGHIVFGKGHKGKVSSYTLTD